MFRKISSFAIMVGSGYDSGYESEVNDFHEEMLAGDHDDMPLDQLMNNLDR